MTGEIREVPLNLETFQLSIVNNSPQATRGIPIGLGTDGRLYIDPQQEYCPNGLGHADPDNLTLRVHEDPTDLSTKPRISGGKLYDASLGVWKTPEGHVLPSVHGPSEKSKKDIVLDLSVRIGQAIGQSALVGIVARDGHMVENIVSDDRSVTTLLHNFTVMHPTEYFYVSAILLGRTGKVEITHPTNPEDRRGSRSTYSLSYELGSGIIIDGFEGFEDEGGGGGGPEPDDREPRTPILPLDSAAAAVESTVDQPLQLVGKPI